MLPCDVGAAGGRRSPSRRPPILSDDDRRALLAACVGRDFVESRDTALLRMFIATGGRRADVAGLTVDAVERDTDGVRLFGEGRRARQVTPSPNTARVIERCSRSRGRDRFADRLELWLSERSRGPLSYSPASRRC